MGGGGGGRGRGEGKDVKEPIGVARVEGKEGAEGKEIDITTLVH